MACTCFLDTLALSNSPGLLDLNIQTQVDAPVLFSSVYHADQRVSKEKHIWNVLFSLCVLAITSMMFTRHIVKSNTYCHV